MESATTDILYEPKRQTISPQPEDYGYVLREFGLSYEQDGHYYLVGGRDEKVGWLLDISGVRFQFGELLRAVVAVLAKQQVSFRVIIDAQRLDQIQQGSMGYLELGKTIVIKVRDRASLVTIAAELVRCTSCFIGPEAPQGFALGAIVYARYGALSPIGLTGQNGRMSSFGKGEDGNLIRLDDMALLMIPAGVEWPFQTITKPFDRKMPPMLKGRYYGYRVLKSDAKGKVVQGVWLKRFFRMEPCVIKEGRKAMFMDGFGRDIRNRLEWQYRLHRDVEGRVPVPAALDLFEVGGNAYLVMEYVQGVPLVERLSALFNWRSWCFLDPEEKLAIIDYLLALVDAIGALHQCGYVHRDVMPANFLVDSNDKLWLIDLELAYSMSNTEPSPPFKLGTPGFMSPEQIATERPTIKEDIYGFGASMIFIFTGISPSKFDDSDRDGLVCRLFFFIRNRSIAETIVSCVDPDPGRRPELDVIKAKISGFRAVVTQGRPSTGMPSYNLEGRLRNLPFVIESALRSYTGALFSGPQGLWASAADDSGEYVVNNNEGYSVQVGIKKGLAGIIYMLAVARGLDFSLGDCGPVIERSIEFLQKNFVSYCPNVPPGLLRGAAGVGVALAVAVESGIIARTNEVREAMQKCFGVEASHIGLASGAAGIGIGLLASVGQLDSKVTGQQLAAISAKIQEAQSLDGSWLMPLTEDGQRVAKFSGYFHGAAGLVHFLLANYKKSGNAADLKAAEKGLNWLQKTAKEGAEGLYWHISDKSKEKALWAAGGMVGIAMVLIRAYGVTGCAEYKVMAEKVLRKFPRFIVHGNFTQERGLPGLGEVYIDAYRTFGSEEWFDRARWIGALLMYASKSDASGSIYWQEDNFRTGWSGDLLVGNAGIVHFLMRLARPETLGHSLMLFV